MSFINTRTGEEYLDLLRRGYEKRDAVLFLAARHGVVTSAIYNRLRRADVLPPYNPRRQMVRHSSGDLVADGEIIARRVERDPCPRCGTRGDIRCGHRRAPGLSNVVFAA